MKKISITKEQRTFIIRAALFVLFGALLPIVFVLWRYDIFTDGPHAIGGVGLLVGIIAIIASIYVIHEVRTTLPYSFLTQVLTGIARVVVPLLGIYILLDFMKDSIYLLSQSVLATMLCECVAIPVNPFPKWKHDHGIEEKDEGFLRFARIFRKAWKEEQ